MSRLADGYVTLRILKLLATPIKKTKAYELGIVDADGTKIKNPITSTEKDAYSMLQRFVFKVQKALTKSPDRNAKRLLTVAAALSILRENEDVLSLSEEEFDSQLALFEGFDQVKTQASLLELDMLSFKTYSEEVAANAVGGGGIDGIGIGPKGEPGRDPVMMPMVRRRKKKKKKNVR